jgi:hypothetical protein
MHYRNNRNMFDKTVQNQPCLCVVHRKAIAVVSKGPLKQIGWRMVMPLVVGWVALVTVSAKHEVFSGPLARLAMGS